MKMGISKSMKKFLENHSNFFCSSEKQNTISYHELKRYWLQYKESQQSNSVCLSLHDLLYGSDISWEEFYPQKHKTDEQMKAYKIRLQKLEYDQLTKGMEEKSHNYLKDSHKKELSTVLNCMLTVIGMFIAFYALTHTIGCQPVTCICSGLTAALVIATIELYYLLRTL